MPFFPRFPAGSSSVGQSAFARCALIAAILVGAFDACKPASATEQSVPKFQGDNLPEPPAQKLAWKPPADSKFSTDFLKATDELFQSGLADPRACEYRQVAFATGSEWNEDVDIRQFHAWVLPANEPIGNDPKNPPLRFAVAWNGLIYPLAKVGEKADLRLDVKAACKADEDARAAWDSGHSHERFSHFPSEINDTNTASEKTLWSVKVHILLRLGETALAERVWRDWICEPNNGHAIADQNDPFMMAAEDWLRTCFERCITAHIRGDDRLALVDAKALVAAKKSVEAIAVKRGCPCAGDVDDGKGCLDFLKPAPFLLVDQQRRFQAKPPENLKNILAATFAKENGRIDALINALDQIDDSLQGGGENLEYTDPILRALMDEGDAAVEPLLQCLAHDNRLTRCVRFYSDYSRDRLPITVREAAYIAIAGILDRSFLPTDSHVDDLSDSDAELRRVLVSRIHEYWNTYKDLPLDERWFTTLADDSASAGEWSLAAARITQPGSPPPWPAGAPYESGFISLPWHKPGEPMALQGDGLRNKSNPSVSDLLVKRLSAVGSDTFADALAEWDGRKHLKQLRDYSEVLRKRLPDHPYDYLASSLAKLYATRAGLGDENALREYAQWIRTTSPLPIGSELSGAFAPMAQFGDRKEIAAVAEDLFNGPPSPWNSHQPPIANVFARFTSISIPLMGMPAFHKQLKRELSDKSIVAKVKYDGEYSVSILGDQGIIDSYNTGCKNDPLRPEAGEELPFRICDYVAWRLQFVGGFPHVELYWPEKARDAAVDRAREILQQYGERFKWTRDHKTYFLTSMVFPELHDPATREDVAQGRAVFALDGERRVVPFSARSVRFATLKQVSNVRFWSDSGSIDGPQKAEVTWAQDGSIWQAEEVKQGDKWVRWYGFVGPGYIGKALATEIELSPDGTWSEFSRGVQLCCDLPAMKTAVDSRIPINLGDPILIELHIRNALGIDQAIPSEWCRPAEKALRPGVSVRVDRSTSPLPNRTGWGDDGWEQIPVKPIRHFQPTTATKTLSMGQELPTVTFDLRDFCTLDKPGQYLVRLVGLPDAASKMPPETNSELFTLVVPSARK